MRFTELKACIPNISDRMLTLHLKEMEQDGLVERAIFAEVPPRVEYKLTPSTQLLVSIWDQLEVWGSSHRENQERKDQHCDNLPDSPLMHDTQNVNSPTAHLRESRLCQEQKHQLQNFGKTLTQPSAKEHR